MSRLLKVRGIFPLFYRKQTVHFAREDHEILEVLDALGEVVIVGAFI